MQQQTATVQNVSSVGLRKKIYYKDWSMGPIVTFSHGWPLNADAWTAKCSARVVS